MKNPTELSLRDIHLPTAIDAEFLALGEWILLIFMPLALFLSYRLYLKLTGKTTLKTAKIVLETLKKNKSQTTNEKLAMIAALIRRVAVSCDLRTDCASLTGEAWLSYLDKSLGKNAFSKGAGRVLILGQYQKEIDQFDLNSLILLTESWLRAQK
jgi:hypothetical protein